MTAPATIATRSRSEANLWLSLGANLGDPERTIREALRHIAMLERTTLVAISHVYRSSPVGYLEQPPFFNLAAAVSTSLSPERFAAECRRIEQELGRRSRPKWHEREIDIDLLIYRGRQIRSDSLTLPHPRMNDRTFVIYPLAEIAPELRDPTTGSTIAEIRERLEPAEGEWIERVPERSDDPAASQIFIDRSGGEA